MRTLTANLQAVLNGDLTLATCWLFERTDGIDIGVTNFQEDLTVSAQLYMARSGFTRSDTQHSLGLSADNHDIVGYFDSAAFTRSDLLARKYDDAKVSVFMVDYNNPDDGRLWISIGTLGQSKLLDGRFTIEFRSYMQLLELPIGEYFGPYCRHKLGSPATDPITGRPGCGVDLSTSEVADTIDTIVNARRSFTSAARTEADQWWAGGEITFTSGANNGLTRVIRSSLSSGTIELVENTPFDMAVTDTFTATPGCNHLFRAPSDPAEGPYTGDCIVKWVNKDNFGGEPEALTAALSFGGLK